MNIPEKAELMVLIHHFGRFSNWGIPIYNTEVPESLGKRKKEEIAITKLYALQANRTSTFMVRRFDTE